MFIAFSTVTYLSAALMCTFYPVFLGEYTSHEEQKRNQKKEKMKMKF